ncbi:MAG TPA: SpoIIE family protein phosphatase [Thermoanaerobaculia bacterium]|nr:SpoIIE family protein phosphatase [Thermoanaerobaculia bacterium]
MSQVPESVHITLYQPNVGPTTHVLEAPTVTLGRSSDCTVPIKDRFLSRHHAELIKNGNGWILHDCGSANGTFLNGARIEKDVELRRGDRIAFGDSEIVFDSESSSGSHSLSVHDSDASSEVSIPIHDLEKEASADRQAARLRILNDLALELIEDRPLNELFDFILDRVMKLLSPSRAAIALLEEDRKTFLSVNLRRRDGTDTTDLTISRTLLAEVVDEKKVVSFLDVSENEKLGRAMSIISQSIRSAICAPLVVGDAVRGILYVDFLLSQPQVSSDELRLLGQIARFAAVKLETTRLREEAYAKQKMDEELRTAYEIQSRLLPSSPPVVEGFDFAGVNHPCRTVSGDYYDFVVQPDGRIYFVIADVSGKGITAALVMASLATAFNIFTRTNPTPAQLVRELNVTLCPKLSPRKFVTLFAGLLDPVSGVIEYTNAGHVPPLLLTASGVSELRETDMVVGLFATSTYHDQKVKLEPGDSLILFTDGIVEAENSDQVELGISPVLEIIAPLHRSPPMALLERIEQRVREHAGGAPAGDDITLLALTRSI